MAFDSAHGDYVTLLILLLIVIRKDLQKYSQMVVQSSTCSTEQAQILYIRIVL